MASSPPNAGAIVLISGIIVATKGMLSTIEDRTAEAHRMAKPAAAMLPPVASTSLFSEKRQQSAYLDAVHDDEQADEEEDGDPLHIAERLMDVVRRLLGVVRPIVEQHQDTGAEHGDRRRLEMQRPGEHEGHDHHSEHHERLLQEHAVHDRLARDHVHHGRPRIRGCGETPPPDRMGDRHLHQHDHHDHRRQVVDEGVEVEIDLRADQDVGGSPIRVAVPPMFDAKISANRNG